MDDEQKYDMLLTMVDDPDEASSYVDIEKYEDLPPFIQAQWQQPQGPVDEDSMGSYFANGEGPYLDSKNRDQQENEDI